MDAFDVLALGPSFDLDMSELERRYRDLQKQLHPDKFVQASASERRESLARAVDVNRAYRVLRDDLQRAELLLLRLSGPREGRETTDPSLLMEVMELREGLAEAKAARDQAAVGALRTDVSQREAEAIASLRATFGKHTAGADPEELVEAHRALARLRYYRRFQEEVVRFEEETAE
jgi:molecular chaperone HscB